MTNQLNTDCSRNLSHDTNRLPREQFVGNKHFLYLYKTIKATKKSSPNISTEAKTKLSHIPRTETKNVKLFGKKKYPKNPVHPS